VGSGIGTTWRRRRQRSTILREVVDSVRAMPHGMSQSRVREMLADELRRRDLSPPVTEFALAAMVKTVLAGDDHTARLKVGVEVGRDLFTRHGGVKDLLLGQPQAHGINLVVQNPIILEPDRSQAPLQVELDRAVALERQRGLDEAEVAVLPGIREIFVRLSRDGAGDDNRVWAAIGDNYRIGSLATSDGRLFDAASCGVRLGWRHALVVAPGRDRGRQAAADAVLRFLRGHVRVDAGWPWSGSARYGWRTSTVPSSRCGSARPVS
jgi:hypothetical protein